MDVAARLKFFREQKGFTVNRLANQAGISQSYVRDIELGNKNPTVDLLETLCEALDITLKDFFNDETLEAIDQNRALQAVYRLTSKQQELLLDFLQSI